MIEKNELASRKHIQKDLKPLIAFFTTFAAMILIFFVNQIIPFGARNSLTSDLGAQYGPYLIGYKHALQSGQSLLYSQSLGMGQNSMGVFAYYLSSPLSFLVFLFPESRLPEAITILITVKLSLAGAFMTWLLDRKFEEKSRFSILFGMMYPLCSFIMVFMFNIMWLDGFAILPLLILLTDSFVKNHKKWPLLTLLLLVLFVSGYYMAYMVGIFSFIYLISTMAYSGAFKADEKGALKTVGLFILSAIVGAMMSACILVPAGLDTLRNGDFTKAEAITLDPSFKLVSFVDQLLNTGGPELDKNLPMVFSGLAVLFLCILFFFNKHFTKKLKILIGVALGAALVSFHMPLLNRAWHLFDSPNWFNYRYSYLMSFVMILVAYYSFLHMKEASKKHYLISYGIIAGLACISQSAGAMSKENSTFLATLLIAALIALLLYGMTLSKWPEQIVNLRKYGAGFLAAVILVEIVVFNPHCYMPAAFSGTNDGPQFEDMIEAVEILGSKEDTSRWSRSEIHYPWHDYMRGNTTAFYAGKNGISIFASMANKRTNHFLKQLGYQANYNYFCVEHTCSIIPADSILGIRYLITNSHNLSGVNYVTNADTFYLYENPYAASIAMLAEADAGAFDGYALEKDEHKKDYFTFQENWIHSLSGLEASDIYDTFTTEWEIYNAQESVVRPKASMAVGVIVDNSLNQENKNCRSEELKYYTRNSDKMPIVLRTKFEVEEDKPLYLIIPYLYLTCVGDIYVNDKLIFVQDTSSYYSQIINLGAYKKGETITVDIRSDSPVFTSFEPIFAYCNAENLKPHVDKLSSGVSNLNVENGHISLQASCEEAKTLILTVPFEKGWEATVDGQKVELVSYQDALISIPLSAGNHAVELRFTPPGWHAGLAASAAGTVLFALVSFIICKKRQTTQKSNKEKEET
ncbi:MAG: YfhO family protein [Clostridiales bacterium]|nr:YfhO family protein [Clostridiales bacterium]